MKELDDFDIQLNIDSEEIYTIDIDAIDQSCEDTAKVLTSALSSHVLDKIEEPMPHISAKLQQTQEALRLYMKMLKCNEQAHDILLKNISANSGNASLYQALSRLQSSIIETRNNVDKTMSTMETQLKLLQMDMNLGNTDKDDAPEDTGLCRGTRDLIMGMQKENLN